MKQPRTPSASSALRAQLAADEQQLDAWRENENRALAQHSELQGQLADLQRNVHASDAAALAKRSAALRRQIDEAQAALEDARAIGDRLAREIASNRQRLASMETIELRHRAVQSVAELVKPAAEVEQAAANLVAAIRKLREAGAASRTLVSHALVALGHDETRMLDMQDIVVSRAAARGSEMASAVTGMLREIASASGARLDDYVAFNEFVSCGQTPTSAIQRAVEVVASRLDVQP